MAKQREPYKQYEIT